MRNSWKTSLLSSLALSLFGTSAAAQSGENINHISGVQVDETTDHTVIQIIGDAHPTFSEYQLQRPLRVFVDVANSALAEEFATIDVDNGVISSVMMVEIEDSLTHFTRVIIGLDQDALYDVDIDGDSLVISVDGRDRRLFVAEGPSTDADMVALRTELAAAQERVDALEAAAARASSVDASSLRIQVQNERDELERLQALEQQVVSLSQANATAQAQVVELTEAREEAFAQFVEVSVANEQALAQVTELAQAHQFAVNQVGQLTSELDALQSDRATALDHISTTQSQLTTARTNLDARDAEITSLRSREEALEAQIASRQADGDSDGSLGALLAERDLHVAALLDQQHALEALVSQFEAQEADLAVSIVEARQMGDQEQRLRQQQQELSSRETQLETALGTLHSEQVALTSREASLDAREVALADQASDFEALREQWSAPTVVAAPEILNVRFDHEGDTDRVIIEVAAGAAFTSLPWDDGRAGIQFDGAVLPDHLQRTLDTTAFDGPVDYISSFTDGDGHVRIVAELEGTTAEVIRQEANQLVWEFTATTPEPYAQGTIPMAGPPGQDPIVATYTSQAQDYNVTSTATPSAESRYTQRPRMDRSRITLDVRDAPIEDILRLFGDEGNLNIVASDSVGGQVTMRLRSVPLDEALMVILRSQGLGWEQSGNILRVAPMETFEEEYDAELERMAANFELAPLQVRLVPVSYAEAGDLSTLITGILSSRGSIAVDERNNTLIITDIVSNLDAAEMLVSELDNQTPQILIEARIVETNDQFRRQLGIQWGGDFVADQSLGNATGLLFPSTVGIGGGATDGSTPVAGGSGTPNYAVNLPAPAGTGDGGAIGFTFGSLGGALNLNVRLSAAERSGSVKIVSAPRIMTLDNEPASISSGVSIPVSVVSAAGTQTVFIDASLELEVTPRVTQDGNIFLEVSISKNEPDFENTGARGDPSIIRREAQTQLLVRDGDTSVIGGIFQHNQGFSSASVPFLGSLPVIGPLFRNSSQTDVRNELLVFITPRIVNRDLSIDAIGNGADIIPPSED